MQCLPAEYKSSVNLLKFLYRSSPSWKPASAFVRKGYYIPLVRNQSLLGITNLQWVFRIAAFILAQLMSTLSGIERHPAWKRPYTFDFCGDIQTSFCFHASRFSFPLSVQPLSSGFPRQKWECTNAVGPRQTKPLHAQMGRDGRHSSITALQIQIRFSHPLPSLTQINVTGCWVNLLCNSYSFVVEFVIFLFSLIRCRSAGTGHGNC